MMDLLGKSGWTLQGEALPLQFEGGVATWEGVLPRMVVSIGLIVGCRWSVWMPRLQLACLVGPNRLLHAPRPLFVAWGAKSLFTAGEINLVFGNNI